VAGRSDAELGALVGQAIVDAYGEYEQLASFHVVIKEHLAVPFRTTVLGDEVTAYCSAWRLPSSTASIPTWPPRPPENTSSST